MKLCKLEKDMLPIGPLMIEHRLIDKIIELLEDESKQMRATNVINLKFINQAVDFLKVYADRCHHGKEEKILFKALRAKPLSAQDKDMLEGLINDHIRARLLVGKISEGVGKNYIQRSSEVTKSIASIIEDLTKLYRSHVHKEDKQFFVPAMNYFSKEEQDNMLCEFWEFDRTLIHEKYKSVVSQLEKGE